MILALFAIELSPCKTVISELEKPTEKLMKVQLRLCVPNQSSERAMELSVTGAG